MTKTRHTTDEDWMAEALQVQWLRDQGAAMIREQRKSLRALKGRRIYAMAHSSVYEHARRIQQDHPSQAIGRIEDRMRRMARIGRAPLPWERDRDWYNPYSTEWYSACGYEDAIVANRDDARKEAEQLRLKIRALKRQGFHVNRRPAKVD